MSSVRERMLEVLATKLAAVPNATIYRSRENAVARNEGTVVIIQPENEQVEKRASNPGGIVLKNFLLDMSVISRGDPADQVADLVIVAAHAAIMSDPTLGNLCSQIIEHSTEWTFEEADQTAVEVLVRYQIRYMTSTKDITTNV